MQSRRDVQRQRSRISGKKLVVRTLMFLLVVILVTWGTFALATQPMRSAQHQAIRLAKRYAGLKTTNGFYTYNRDHTYYTVSGENRQGQAVLVIVPQKGGKLRVVKQSNGLTKQEAIAKVRSENKVKKVLRAAPGVFNDHVVWEVSYRNANGSLCYDLLNFTSGKYVQRINNL
ncbi:DUF5590 domain-containing protein [Lactobacillus alvi]|uniref:DUF5590 domain-containing protein n=1 Tax=Limosilactobacillus alvi TaxID=990412 RepID=A0ABS2EQ70_9LACO|nr:DUF5590 domain-containing protein [Limosilactobacillus alvi]MBM6754654.1 DUF5590 domain-containing protein [Limosilactobacillus alvi]